MREDPAVQPNRAFLYNPNHVWRSSQPIDAGAELTEGGINQLFEKMAEVGAQPDVRAVSAPVFARYSWLSRVFDPWPQHYELFPTLHRIESWVRTFKARYPWRFRIAWRVIRTGETY